MSHSKSPEIHQQFARQFGLQIRYDRIHVDVGGFPQAVDSFRAGDGRGLNVTVPFKVEAWRLADRPSERAKQAGAANTLWFEGRITCADNTDGIGLCRDITQNLRHEVRHKRVLVLGAGGAVRGVLGPLLEQQPEFLFIANRTVDKAEEMVQQLGSPAQVEVGGFSAIDGRFDIVINGTSASLQGQMPPLPEDLFYERALAYDMVYGQKPTLFMRFAADHGAAQVTDGLGMLVEQAAESFSIWHGKRPHTGTVINGLRKR